MIQQKILILEDNHPVLEGIIDLYKYIGHSPSGETRFTKNLYERLKKEHFDLLLIDIMLSGHDGCNLVKRFKNTAEIKDTTIIMMSAYPNMEPSVKASGADDFLQKPFGLEELEAKNCTLFKDYSLRYL